MRTSALFVLCALVVASCAETDPLVGEWDAYDSTIGPTRLNTLTLGFAPNGAYQMTMGKLDIQGLWTRSGNVIKLSPRNSGARSSSGFIYPGSESVEMQMELTVSEDGTELTLEKHFMEGAGTLVFTKR